MATIITVHGTFAHANSPDAKAETEPIPQWWEAPGILAKDLNDLVDVPGGSIEIQPFEWSGFNSEEDRRAAGQKLIGRMRDLEAKNEPYCVIGHSHGGSIVSSALLDGAARKQPLTNLKRWITIGTPFVTMRKELLLLTRLSLMRKVILVASMMLLLMYLVYLGATILSKDPLLFGVAFPRVGIITAVVASVPAIIIYLLFRYLDSRSSIGYHPKITERAKSNFAPRWLSLAHPDDEAIQGLASLPDAKLSFFDSSFAVSTITLISVITLPLLYFAVLFSPQAMVGIANWLKTEIYEERSSPEAEQALIALRNEVIEARKAARADNQTTQEPGVTPQQFNDKRRNWSEGQRGVWADYRAKREALEEKYPNLDAVDRGLRFKQRFFTRNGQPCDGGILCGGGNEIAINSGLLLHVVTDEFSWALGTGDLGNRRSRWFWSIAVPALLVPLVLGFLALGLMLLIKALAGVISTASSRFLNNITNAEVKRSAFGNDTEGEVATGANDRPSWIATSQPRLPAALADIISAYSNDAASQSIAKFRHAIGRIASAEPQHTADTAISTYFTWKELVHSSYFDVPEFRKLVAQAVSRVEGFAPSAKFLADPDYQKTADWLSAIEGQAAAPPHSDVAPREQDPAAVSAVVASTVKATP